MQESKLAPSNNWTKGGICSFIALLCQSLTISAILPLGYLSPYFCSKDILFSFTFLFLFMLPPVSLSLFSLFIKKNEKVFGIRFSVIIGQSILILKVILILVVEKENSLLLLPLSIFGSFFCGFGLGLSNTALKKNFYMYFPNAGKLFPIVLSSFVALGAAGFNIAGELIINKGYFAISSPFYIEEPLYPEEVTDRVNIFFFFYVYAILILSALALAFVVPYKNPTEEVSERSINKISEARNEELIPKEQRLVNLVMPKLTGLAYFGVSESNESFLLMLLSLSTKFGLGMFLVHYRITGEASNIDEKYLRLAGILIFVSIFVFIPIWSLINACVGFKYSMTIMNGLAIGVAVAMGFTLNNSVLYTITVVSASALFTGTLLLEPHIREAIKEEYISGLIIFVRIFGFAAYTLGAFFYFVLLFGGWNNSVGLSIIVGLFSIISYVISIMINNTRCTQQQQDEARNENQNENQERQQEEML